MSDWISTVDRFPSFGVPVLVAAGGIVQYVAYSLDTAGWYPETFDGDVALLGTFSHWMPLPDPPTTSFARGYWKYERMWSDQRYVREVLTIGRFDSEEQYKQTQLDEKANRTRIQAEIQEEIA